MARIIVTNPEVDRRVAFMTPVYERIVACAVGMANAFRDALPVEVVLSANGAVDAALVWEYICGGGRKSRTAYPTSRRSRG